MTSPFNPFSGPFSGHEIGGNPLDDEANLTPRCPKCKSTNFHAWSGEYGITRRCLVPTCKEEWSGGSIAVGRPLFIDPSDIIPDGAAAPDLDLPAVQYTGAYFRDPSKTFGGDDE